MNRMTSCAARERDHDPNVFLVHGDQSARDSADGRDGDLWLLHFAGKLTGFRRCRAQSVSQALKNHLGDVNAR